MDPTTHSRFTTTSGLESATADFRRVVLSRLHPEGVSSASRTCFAPAARRAALNAASSVSSPNKAITLPPRPAPVSLAPAKPAYADHAPTISGRGLDEFGMTLPESLANCGCVVE